MLQILNQFCKNGFRSLSSIKPISKIKNPPWKVLFFGSDEFSLYSLKALWNEYASKETVLNTVDVVTNSRNNPVWKFCEENKLNVYKWPLILEDNNYDLGLVVSFGHLIPESIIKRFPLGMLNVHASLLPRWRGAAPIIYALANDDRETGITIMRIKPKHFDIGEILYQEKVLISPKIDMPDLHEKLGVMGAKCLVATLRNLEKRLANCKPQSDEGVTYAPKVTPEFAQIKWHEATSNDIYHLQRALRTLLPLTAMWNSTPVKLIDIEICVSQKDSRVPGFVEYDKKSKTLIVECANKTWIRVKKIGIHGKKVMSATDFNNGYLKKEPLNKMCCFS